MKIKSYLWRFKWYRRAVAKRGLSRLGVRAPGQPDSVVRGIARVIRRAIMVGVFLTTVASADWVTPKGKAYHSKRACIALRTTQHPEEITSTEAASRGLKPCGICNRTKKEKK